MCVSTPIREAMVSVKMRKLNTNKGSNGVRQEHLKGVSTIKMSI